MPLIPGMAWPHDPVDSMLIVRLVSPCSERVPESIETDPRSLEVERLEERSESCVELVDVGHGCDTFIIGLRALPHKGITAWR